MEIDDAAAKQWMIMRQRLHAVGSWRQAAGSIWIMNDRRNCSYCTLASEFDVCASNLSVRRIGRKVVI